jgi:hypothetical protein
MSDITSLSVLRRQKIDQKLGIGSYLGEKQGKPMPRKKIPRNFMQFSRAGVE